MKFNTAIISDAVADAANDAIRNAIENAYITSYDVDTSSVEEEIEDAIQEAIEKDREERKPEQPFSFSELMDLRTGIHQLRMRDTQDRAAQFAMALEFNIDLESDKWKEFKMKRDTQLEALYDKVTELLDNLNAK